MTKFLAADRLLQDAKVIVDAGRGPAMTKAMTALSLLRNYRPFQAPKGLTLARSDQEVRQADGRRAGRPARRRRPDGDRKSDEWLLMFVAGMWFQDLWTYDFRRTEMCIIPYATQMGEISFCAYNTGVGWRQIVEKMHQNATYGGVVQDPRQTRGLCQSAQERTLASADFPEPSASRRGRPDSGVESPAQIRSCSGSRRLTASRSSDSWSEPERAGVKTVVERRQ